MSKEIYIKKFRLVLFNPHMGTYLVLPLRARVNLRAMVIKGHCAFPKAPAFLEPDHQIVSITYRILVGEGYPSAEKQSE